MEEKAQVNLEYLLIITGAIAIVTVVSLYIKSTANTINQTTTEQSKQTP
ncbi:MAG: hypothetical protein WC821_02865 [archaeon]|jgi:uncharacterized protein (UPF0333 family)